MATSLSSLLGFDVSAVFESSVDLGTVSHTVGYGPRWNLSNGTGANQANQIFTDTRTLTASSSENLDLAGGLTDAFGNTITFTKIKGIFVVADSANTNDVLVGGAASNGFSSWVNDPTDVVKVKPGGGFATIAPNSTGLAVTAGTGDILKVANSGGTTSVSYTIVIVGTV